jgi:thiamine pyrophosphokinase
MMFYLTPVEHIIHLKTDLIYKKYCGLVPFGKVNQIETKGFKWNLGKK